ncbi:MAG: 7TM diverse intracellular signaling domain-containing protein [Candidatus Sphingomonas colombiensis]|nr:7TM diverse intracellular signaling domain-containing protein [Sphingomonas sp.]WEK43609.1 MAG: 7TM diverse intracellular signaling domain-containing protein [Sphingomonas sp.]
MVSCLRWLVCLVLALATADGAAAKDRPFAFRTIEAARSGWNAATPPTSGWERVALPDDWSRRWPGFDGVVWYRLTWRQEDASRPVALMIDYWTLAGAAYLNGQLLERDPQLVEPLSRSWNAPRRWQLSPPMLREGANVLLVRVSGHAVYQPGLGPATLGDPALISARYDAAQIVRRALPTFNLGITVALASFFLAIWLMRRRETAYGWYSMATFAWAGYSLNLVARSPWPFATSDGWARTTIIFLLLFAVSHCLFILRFLDRRYPRAEMLSWAGFAAGAALLIAVPHGLIGATRVAMSGAAFATYLWRGPVFLCANRAQPAHRPLGAQRQQCVDDRCGRA